jgi:GT2 family glycosyltransferase
MSWWDYSDARTVDQPMASALMIEKTALDKIGHFDECFPMFFNDVDLCKRLWDAGYEVWFTPVVEMKHEGGAATRQVRRAMIRASHEGMLAYYAKHYRGKINPLVYWCAVGLLRLSVWGRLAVAAITGAQ